MILELCKGVHCVDLGESFPMSIYLQNLASIQPRTSPLKFAASRDGASARSRIFKRWQTLLTIPFYLQSLLKYMMIIVVTGHWMAPYFIPEVHDDGKISTKFSSFSAVSAPIFASKYAFCGIFQNLPDYRAGIFEIRQIFADFATFAKKVEFS